MARLLTSVYVIPTFYPGEQFSHVNNHDQIQCKNPVRRAFRTISRDVNAPCRFMLKNQGNFHAARASRLRSSNINEIDRLTCQHGLNKQIREVVATSEHRIARPHQPIKQLFGRKQLWIEGDFLRTQGRGGLFIFHAHSVAPAVGQRLSTCAIFRDYMLRKRKKY
jgi:hypothetical protein